MLGKDFYLPIFLRILFVSKEGHLKDKVYEDKLRA